MNALLAAASRFGQGGSVWERGGSPEVNCTYGGAGISCRVEYTGAKESQTLTVRVDEGRFKGAVWKDSPASLIENQITEIVVTMARLSVEAQRTMDAEMAAVKRRMAVEAEEARLAAEAEAIAAAKARVREVEKQRIDALLQAAANSQRATIIRGFVAQIIAEGHADEAVTRWAQWASEQADAIDPTRNGWLSDAILLRTNFDDDK